MSTMVNEALQENVVRRVSKAKEGNKDCRAFKGLEEQMVRPAKTSSTKTVGKP